MSGPAIPLSVLLEAQRALTLARQLPLFAPTPDQVRAVSFACAGALGQITYYVDQHSKVDVPVEAR